MRQVLALAFFAWCAFITVAAGVIGSILNCEYSGDCTAGSPSWLEPWTWGDFYVYPTALLVGLIGLVSAGAFVALVWARRRSAAALALLVAGVLISYPFFAGLTASGRMLLWPGVLLGVAALVSTRSRYSVAA